MNAGPVWKIELLVPGADANAYAEAVEPFAAALSMFEINGTPDFRVMAYGADEPDEDRLKSAVRSVAEARGTSMPPLDVVWLPDTDWVAENQARFEPVRAGRFHIHDSYHLDPPPAGMIPIMVDAATAFGTGHHGTTRGCLEAFDMLLRAGVVRGPILDLGCGTGILGIAAAKAARLPVLASDIDPVAVAMARENTRVNGVGAYVRSVHSRGLEAGAVRRRGPFELVFANILSRPLQRLAPAIAAARTPGAPVILSGLLHHQEPAVLSAYRTQGMALHLRLRRDEWSTLVVR